MFNLIVSGDSSAWESIQDFSMDITRFHEFSGNEAQAITAKEPQTLQVLENLPTLLIYEWCAEGGNVELVRFGYVASLRLHGKWLVFSFHEEAHCDRELIEEFASALKLDDWERTRTHWAIKDGQIPSELRQQMVDGSYQTLPYDVVLSYAQENLDYVQRVAIFLKANQVKVFFDRFEEAELWGRDLTEELDIIFRMKSRHCVMFVSKQYASKQWPTFERRAAMSRAVEKFNDRYLLPCRFDDTDVPGLSPSISYIDLTKKTPEQLGEMILIVLRRKRCSKTV